MSKGSRRAYRTGLSHDLIIDAAVALTVERGLDGWSMRDLVARLDTSLSVIYHHVGDQERVRAAVVERVYAQMDLAIGEPNWRRLLHGVLTAMIDHLAEYPGVAAWLMRNGPQSEQLVPLLDAGMTRMLEAGWGEEAAAAYSVAFNSCLGLIALADQHVVGGGPDAGLPGLREMLGSHPSAGAGAEQMRRMVERFTGPDTERAAAHREYCRYALDRVLDGLELRLNQLTNAGIGAP
ncbi:TetR/AcrR family transcriptional regulator [Nocardia arthritidis]|uniref:TetR family transcriptional regulator n=1 Tax=Nocardia arthritidis TaxID=228602 RepID=A0A6G9YA35_9NOCA|nr:TetR/AcrR family transcriptional regulator [Nocardia arthritidis]QIS10089.1 TetR family transcriptional regulator [Nocardia arthritidis]